MRVADVQLTFPAILIALVVDGVAKAAAGGGLDTNATIGLIVVVDRPVLLGAICPHGRAPRRWSRRTRTTSRPRRLIGLSAPVIMVRHVLPNVHRAGLRDRDHQSRARDHHRGDALVPRRRPARDHAVARHPDPHRQRLPVLRRMVDRRLPGPGPRRIWSWRSTCSATGCATRSTRSCNEPIPRPLRPRPARRVRDPPRHARRRSTASPSTSRAARSSASSANPARASR